MFKKPGRMPARFTIAKLKGYVMKKASKVNNRGKNKLYDKETKTIKNI
jgi:hypothetical protein